MKLKQIYEVFFQATQKLIIEIRQVTTGNTTRMEFNKLDLYRKGVHSLETTGLLKNEISQIQNSLIFSTNKASIRVNLNEGEELKQKILSFETLIKSLANALENITSTKTDKNSISIKIQTVKDFDDLSNISKDLHTILTQVIVNNKIKGKVEIINVENGSIWFDILLGTELAIIIVGELTWASAVIFKKIQEGKIIEQHVKSLKIKNDSLSEIKEAQKKLINQMIDSESKFLHKKYFDSNDNDQMTRIKHSIKLLSNLIGKGTEIHPALNAPEEVSNLFPDTKKLELVESKIKKLTS